LSSLILSCAFALHHWLLQASAQSLFLYSARHLSACTSPLCLIQHNGFRLRLPCRTCGFCKGCCPSQADQLQWSSTHALQQGAEELFRPEDCVQRHQDPPDAGVAANQQQVSVSAFSLLFDKHGVYGCTGAHPVGSLAALYNTSVNLNYFCNVALVQLCRRRKRRMFETLSFLPPLDDDAIAKQVEYIIKNNWTPCLEFSEPEFAYVKAVNTNHIRGTAFCNYMDNRYCFGDFSSLGSPCRSRFPRPTPHIFIVW
jgi:hypothetical protein